MTNEDRMHSAWTLRVLAKEQAEAAEMFARRAERHFAEGVDALKRRDQARQMAKHHNASAATLEDADSGPAARRVVVDEEGPAPSTQAEAVEYAYPDSRDVAGPIGCISCFAGPYETHAPGCLQPGADALERLRRNDPDMVRAADEVERTSLDLGKARSQPR